MTEKFIAVWKNKEVELTVDGLTDFEIQVLKGMRNNNFIDCLSEDCGTWTFSAREETTIKKEQYRGVLASLIKKGYITVYGEGNDSQMAFTEQGSLLFSDYNRREIFK
jgi:hypothetical protein